MEKIIDLHMHTICSDGILTAKQVVDKAFLSGVSVISIADHDTVDAYNDELFSYAKSKDITIIPAVEISTKTSKGGVHVLGYNIDINNEDILKQLYTLRNSRHDYLFDVSSKLEQLGYIINVNELDKIDAVTKAHIALDVVNNPKNETLLFETFGYIPNKGEFIETTMNEGCPAYAKKKAITPVQAADLIRMAGGKVVLAHPVAYKYEDNMTEAETIKLVQDMRADGIEANYIYIDRHNNKIDEVDYWKSFANTHELKVTIGSDFHQDDGIHPTIGLINDLKLDAYEIDNILLWLAN